jgi:hypothetical protein
MPEIVKPQGRTTDLLDALLINNHTYAAWAARSPVQHIQRVPGGQLFDYYNDGFHRVWDTATPVT